MIGHPAIAPADAAAHRLLHTFYSVHSERQLIERMEVDMLFRWCFGLGTDEPEGMPPSARRPVKCCRTQRAVRFWDAAGAGPCQRRERRPS